jgi:Fe-S-cluster-containing hydrogenase component 2
MLRAEVNDDVCQGCHPCSARRVCKTKALMQFDAGEVAVVDQPRCRGCATCLPACPYAAIVMRSSYALGAIPTIS